MAGWWSRLFKKPGTEPPPIDADLAKVIDHAKELIAAGNEALRAACDSRDPYERETQQEIATMVAVRLEILVTMFPRLTITSFEEFEADLAQVRQATKDLRAELWRKQKIIPQRY